MKTVKIWLFVASFLCAAAARAGDVYAVQGSAVGVRIEFGDLLWSTDLLFYNTGASDAIVRFLGTSNRAVTPSPASFTLPPGRNTTLMRIAASWQPGTADPLWIVHLDVPDGVVVESVLFIGTASIPRGAPPEVSPQRFGKVRLPVTRSLIAANQAQVHLGTWLGDPIDMPSRINVGIFNAGSVTAVAHVEVRQACDESTIDERTVTVPANTLVQTNGMRSLGDGCPPSGGETGSALPWETYTVVTVDQPSMTFVSNVANNATPTTSISITP